MKKILWIIFLLFFIYLYLPIPLSGQNGTYNIISGLIWCSNNYSCLHEAGHKLDDDLNWPSQKKEFLNAVQIYMIVDIINNKYDNFTKIILNNQTINYGTFGNPHAELYAEIYAEANGNIKNIPPSLQKFYIKENIK